MSTDPTAVEPAFAGRLIAEFRSILSEERDAPFSGGSVDESSVEAGTIILVEGDTVGDLVVAAVTPETCLGDNALIDTASATSEDATAVATCDGRDLFLFDVRDGSSDGIDYYLNLRDSELPNAAAALLEAVERAKREGSVPPQPPEERMIGALRSALDRTTSAVESCARDAYGEDQAFTAAYDEWRDGDRRPNRTRSFEVAATQYATLLLSRVLGDGTVPGTEVGDVEGSVQPGQRSDDGPIAGRFRDAAANGSASEPAADVALFESFPRDERTRRRLDDAVELVERAPTTGTARHLLGRVYEERIPDAERSARGQFYTPPSIAEALTRWALQPAEDADADEIPRVLDPAAGGGTFTIEAYRALADRFPDAPIDELADRLVAVDVERFPLRLTALHLAAQADDHWIGPAHVYNESFFDLDPTVDRTETLGDAGEIGLVDAVVGNPPYVEASDLTPDADHFRAHLREFGPDDATPYADGEDAIGRNADAYVYFVTQATRFLRDGGRLAFVVPTKWMMSRYGEQFQRFLHDHYRIDAIVGFEARAFEDALVDTALVLLERCSDDRRRRENVVRFVRLRDSVTPSTLLEIVDRSVEGPADGPAIERDETCRIVAVEQSTLADGADHGKIAHYLFAPADLIALLESEELTALGELADVERGAMTGSTSFFFPDDDAVAAYGIEGEFLRPALKSMRGHESIVCDDADVDRRFVDVHEYVETIRDRPAAGPDGASLEERVKEALADDGFDGLLSWIRHAEADGEHRGATCERRDVWFDAGEPPRPEILFQKLLRERLFSIYNRAGAVPSNAVDCIDVHDGVGSKALFGVLNSSIVRAIMEMWGRNEAGMLQLMTYETASLPVPDVRAMSAAERSRIVGVVDDIIDRGESDLRDDDRRRLDEAVLATLESVEITVERLQQMQRTVLERRVRSGTSTEVLVDGSSPPDGIDTPAASAGRDGGDR